MATKHAYYMYRYNRAFTLNLVIMKIRFNKKKKKKHMWNQTSCSCDLLCAWLMWNHILQILLQKSVEKLMLFAEHIKVGWPFRRSSLLKPLVRLITNRLYNVQNQATLSVCLCTNTSVFYCIDIILFFTIITIHQKCSLLNGGK